MAATILSRVISSVTDKRASLVNGCIAREIPITFSSWTRLRIGMRYQFVPTTPSEERDLISTPILSFGLCSGTTNLYTDDTTDFWAGFRTTSGTLEYVKTTNASTTNDRYSDSGGGASGAFYTKVRTTQTSLITGTGNFPIIHPMECCDAAQADSITPGCMFVDYTKGETNWTIRILGMSAATSTPYLTVTEFLYNMELSTPSITNHTWFNSNTAAASNFSGYTLDTVSISWNRWITTLEVSDVAVARLA